MDAPIVEILYKQPESTQSLSSSSDSGKGTEKRRKSFSTNDINSTTLAHTSHSPSPQDLEKKIREAREVSLGVLNQLETTIKIFAHDKKQQEAKDLENQDYNLKILEHIQNLRIENEQLTKTNQQLIIDIVSITDRINSIEQLYKILNDGLYAAQKTAHLLETKLQSSPTLEKVSTPDTAKIESQKKLDSLLEQIVANSSTYEQTKIEYNSTIEQINQLEKQIKELEKQFQQLAKTVDFNLLCSKIMNSSWFDITQPQPNDQEENPNPEKLTLKNLLLEHQKKLLAIETHMKELEQLGSSKTSDPSILDQFNTKITHPENNNASLMRKVQLYMTGSVAVLIASLWMWWHTHKA